MHDLHKCILLLFSLDALHYALVLLHFIKKRLEDIGV